MESNSSYKNSIWIALRFILIAIPGVLIFIFASVFFASSLFAHNGKNPSPFLTGPLSIVGLLMSLYGTGRWGQWRNLYTIASIPAIFFFILILLAILSESLGKACVLIAAAIAVPLLFLISGRMRQNRTDDRKKTKI